MTFDQWWDKETEAVGRKGMGRNGVFYQLAKRAWVAAERKEREQGRGKDHAQQPPSAPVWDSLLQTALRNLPQYISKSGLVGPDMHSAMQCFEVLRDALAQQPGDSDNDR